MTTIHMRVDDIDPSHVHIHPDTAAPDRTVIEIDGLVDLRGHTADLRALLHDWGRHLAAIEIGHHINPTDEGDI